MISYYPNVLSWIFVCEVSFYTKYKHLKLMPYVYYHLQYKLEFRGSGSGTGRGMGGDGSSSSGGGASGDTKGGTATGSDQSL